MVKQNENLVKLVVTDDKVQETVYTSILEENDIEYVVRGIEDAAFDGLYTDRYGYSQIYVFEEDLENAKKLVDEAANNQE